MKLTYKQIARSAGYLANKQFSSSGDSWHWRDKLGSGESSSGKFKTEEEAYKDCCVVCKLITEES